MLGALTPPQGTPVAGEYELLQRLALGGMGEVYVARKRGSGDFEKRVALKLLLPHLSEEPEFIQMFQEEARLAARMNHPNVVQVFDFGMAQGRHFIAMTLVEGVSLGKMLERCRKNGERLPLPLVRLIAVGLCEGLAYVHGLVDAEGKPLHLVHRDVNPVNILVSSSGAVLLTDFGIAKARGSSRVTRPGTQLGKLPYMAPEQIRGLHQPDARVDVYAAALTLYEALTCLSPFRREHDAATLQALQHESLRSPAELRPDVTEGMAMALRRGASRDPAQRFGSVQELLQALLDGPVARPGELGTWVREHCAEELERFRTESVTPPRAIQTKSLLQSTDTDPISKAAPAWGRRAARRGSVLVAAGATLVGGAVALLHRPSAPPPAAQRLTSLPKASSPTGAAVQNEGRVSTQTTGHEAPRPPAPEPSTPPPLPVSRAHKPPAPRHPGSVRVGYVSVDAVPWAALIVDGRELDRTPISRYPLPVGEHLLTFENPDLHQTVRRRVRVQEGRVQRLRIEFSR